ncbi:tribuytltin resistance regulator TbtR, partial [Pseudomonas aeruginosa]|nr:tribuytltin resistance regulator TbtR [Pseudomonas aeruginosa]
ALEAEYLVETLGPSGGFRLGPALGQLISQTQTDIITLLKPYMLELSEQLGESVCVSTLVGAKAYVVDRVVAERELRVVFPIGIKAPAYATAS